MIKKIVVFALKLISFLIVFAVLFGVFQRILIPKYVEGSTISTANTDTFYSLEKNSIDVLFLGPSQMYCSVNAKLLNEKYGIEAFDFGASSQSMVTTYYYLQEALKTQSPKLVMIEVCTIFWEKSTNEQNLAWNYTANKLSAEKVNSLMDVSDGDAKLAARYAFPLFQFHSRWGQLNQNDFHYDYDRSLRGYAPIIGCSEVDIKFLDSSENKKKYIIPNSNKEAVRSIANICSEKNIQLVFFKSPVSNWTKNESDGVKLFMSENGFEFIDLNEKIDAIRIESHSDYFNETHLNIEGANKTTDYLANIIKLKI